MDAVTLEALAGGSTALAEAVKRSGDALHELTRDARGEVLGAHCVSSGARDYVLRAELHHRPPRVRCTCPSRKRPCKHGLALLARWVSEPEAFRLTGQVDALLDLERRERVQSAEAPAPAAVRTADPERLRMQQRGLADARALLEELVSAGAGGFGADGLAELRERAVRLNGLHLSGIAASLRRLGAQLAAADVGLEPSRRQVARSIAQLAYWVTRGTAWVERQLTSGIDSRAQASDDDAAIETRLGRAWTLAELRAQGRSRCLSLVELAWWREEDVGLEARVDTSALIDLESGKWFHDRQIVPLHRAALTAPKASYAGVLEVEDALVYPDATPARVRWSVGSGRTRSGEREDWQRLMSHAVPLERVRERHLAEPLREVPDFALLEVREAVRIEGGVGLVDADGEVLRIDPGAAAILRAWGGPEGPFAAAISLAPEQRELNATLHAVITPEGPVRLGG